jgi:conjugative transposon TraN protein
MKSFAFLTVLLVWLSGYSQAVIPAKNLSVTYLMTTNIIFPYSIDNADIGSAEVIGYKGGKHNNVLFLKAARINFAPTNVSVFTSDGKFYSFIVRYANEPDTLNLLFNANQSQNRYFPDSVNEERLDSDAIEMTRQSSFIHCKAKAEKMKAILNGIYIKDHLVWFRIEIQNESQIDYLPEYVRFYIKEKHTAKRTAVQETDLVPVWRSPSMVVPGNGHRTFVFAFAPFTTRKNKKLIIQISEKNDQRLLAPEASSKTLLKSKII